MNLCESMARSFTSQRIFHQQAEFSGEGITPLQYMEKINKKFFKLKELMKTIEVNYTF